MNGNAHKAIAEATKQLLHPEFITFLERKIDYGKWEKYRKKLLIPEEKVSPDSTYWDLFVLGAVEEDNCKYDTDIDDPDHNKSAFGRFLASQTNGEFQHWLEHFWNTDMKDDHNSNTQKTGFEFTHEYIRGIVSELIGADYFLRSGSWIVQHTTDAALTHTLALIVEAYIMLKYGGSQLFDRYRSAPNRAQRYWDVLKEQYKNGEKERAIFNLGKVCHLLADVGTPAHMHGDGHCDSHDGGVAAQIMSVLQFQIPLGQSQQDGLDDDEYESYTSRIIKNSNGKLPSDWNVTTSHAPIYRKNWNLFNYFESLGDYTRKFDSDDCDGKGKSKPYHWQHFEYKNVSTWDLQRQTNDDLTEYACYQIAQDLIPLTICHTAGVLYHFAKEMNIDVPGLDNYSVRLDSIKILDDTDPCGAGELYFHFSANNGVPKFLNKITANTGETVDLAKKGNNRAESKRSVLTALNPASNNKTITVTTEGEDNDDWWFFGNIISRESLGKTNGIYNASEIDIEHGNQYEAKSSNNKYTIKYTIKHEGEQKSSIKIHELQKDIKPEQLFKLELSKYKEGANLKMQPLSINLDTMHIHLHSLSKRPCKIGTNSTGRKVTFYQYDDEMFKHRGIDATVCINRINKILDLGEKCMQDPVFKKQLRTIKSLKEISEPEFGNRITQIRKEINNDGFKKDLKKFFESNDTEYQYAINQIATHNTKELKPNPETIKWECSNEKDFYSVFSTDCQCCNDQKTRSALEKKIRSFEKKYPDMKDR